MANVESDFNASLIVRGKAQDDVHEPQPLKITETEEGNRFILCLLLLFFLLLLLLFFFFGGGGGGVD